MAHLELNFLPPLVYGIIGIESFPYYYYLLQWKERIGAFCSVCKILNTLFKVSI